MAPPMPDLCTPWAIDWDTALGLCTGVDVSALDGLTDDQKASFLEGAQRWLWWRTGRRYGECSTTITTAYRRLCSCRAVRCTCDRDRLDLSWYGPVREVAGVALNGDDLAADTDYTVVGSILVRLPEGTAWPSTPTLTIDFTYGEDPPADLIQAAGIVAVNDALNCAGCECELPKGTRSISVEGLSIDVESKRTWIGDGLTGIDRVDRVLVRWPWPPRLPAGGCDPATAWPRFDRTSW